jgi:hypothetical protein
MIPKSAGYKVNLKKNKKISGPQARRGGGATIYQVLSWQELTGMMLALKKWFAGGVVLFCCAGFIFQFTPRISDFFMFLDQVQRR